MKQYRIAALALAALLAASIVPPSAFADDETVNLESVVIQTFDDPAKDPWFLLQSKFATAGYPKIAYVKAWPIALFGSNTAGKDLRVLGISMLFDRMEYNWVDIVPGTKSGEGAEAKYQPVELTLPGRVQMLDMWVWSGNFDYYLEAYVRDYKGIVYTIPMGDLTFVGWKNLRINIPGNIPQEKRYLPKREGLRLVKFRIWTRPTEVVAVSTSASDTPQPIIFYFDQIKVLTDTFETLFDGDDLADPAVIQEAWGTSSGSAE